MPNQEGCISRRSRRDLWQSAKAEKILRLYQRLSTLTWAFAVALWGVGDWLTTWYPMTSGAGYESTPIIARTISEFGHLGHAGFKLVVFVGLGILYRVLPRPYRIAVPIGVAVAGAKLTVNNIDVIAAGL